MANYFVDQRKRRPVPVGGERQLLGNQLFTFDFSDADGAAMKTKLQASLSNRPV
jgi:hypothetical protein